MHEADRPNNALDDHRARRELTDGLLDFLGDHGHLSSNKLVLSERSLSSGMRFHVRGFARPARVRPERITEASLRMEESKKRPI